MNYENLTQEEILEHPNFIKFFTEKKLEKIYELREDLAND